MAGMRNIYLNLLYIRYLMKSKTEKIKSFDLIAPQRDYWRKKNRYYYSELDRLMRFLIPEDKKVLEIGCGTGDLLNAVKPKEGYGIDFSSGMISVAQGKYPHLTFKVDDAEDILLNKKFDYIVMSDLLGELNDVWLAFRELRKVTNKNSRIVITYYNFLWEPVIRLAEKLRLKMPQDYQNWLSAEDVENVLYLNGYEIVKRGCRLLLPRNIPLISTFFNRYIAILPVIKKLCMLEYIVAKEIPSGIDNNKQDYKVSVIVPCRNEMGNIESAVDRVPPMGSHTELIFVDGNSTDGTIEKIEEMIEKHKGKKDIKLIHQIPKDAGTEELRNDLKTPPHKMLKLGKGDAVRKGFDAAKGDILMILDSDLTVPPEDLPKFYDAIVRGRGEFINGTRLVYQMDREAMRTLNILGNKFFSLLFTWLLEERIKDTLCGTKVLFKADYEKIKAGREYFGDFDPFGDFDLLFGSAKQNLKIVEVPIKYKRRIYGEIKIERFKHGLILLKMSFIAFKKLKLMKE